MCLQLLFFFLVLVALFLWREVQVPCLKEAILRFRVPQWQRLQSCAPCHTQDLRGDAVWTPLRRRHGLLMGSCTATLFPFPSPLTP